MSQVGYEASPLSKQEWAMHNEIMHAGSQSSVITERRRLFSWFTRFVRTNPGLPETQQSALFLCQLQCGRKRTGSPLRNKETILQYGETVRKCHMKESRLDAIEEQLERDTFAFGLRELAKKHLSSRENKLVSGWIIAWPAAGDAQRLHWKAACYVILATGCRAMHVTRIRSLKFTEDGLRARWFKRKVRAGGNIEWLYKYEWSFKPTADVKDLLEKRWKEFQSALGNPRYISSRLDAYIRVMCDEKGYERFSTRYYRCRMSTILHCLIKERKITEAEFEMLLDRDVRTCLQRYLLPGGVKELSFYGSRKE